MADDDVECSSTACTKPARMALRTYRPTRDRMITTVDFDNRSAVRGSKPYCKACGLHIVAGLVDMLVDMD